MIQSAYNVPQAGELGCFLCWRAQQGVSLASFAALKATEAFSPAVEDFSGELPTAYAQRGHESCRRMVSDRSHAETAAVPKNRMVW